MPYENLEGTGLMRVDVEKIKEEAKEIGMWVDSGITVGLAQKYKKFSMTFPVLFKNIVEKKMTMDEIEVLIDTFSMAQEQFLNNVQIEKQQ